MSGHSKWSTIKHKKAAMDAKRGKIFTKLIKEITVSARLGGKELEGNPRLRTAVAAARNANMPQDNIDRAILKGVGELEGVTYDEVTYEGYALGGVAVLIQVVTDNRNRTVAELRHIFSKSGGNLAEAGAVAWMFEKKGIVLVDREKAVEDELMELVLEAGAEDLTMESNHFVVATADESLDEVRDFLTEQGVAILSAERTMIPQSTVAVAADNARQILTLMDSLDDHDDVQNVYSNFDIPDSVLEEVGA